VDWLTLSAPNKASLLEAARVQPTCERCARSLVGRSAFVLGGQPRCLGCAVRHGPLLRRSTLTALVVGTVLVAINQGTALAAGEFSPRLLWQIPLTYAVPFCVASWGALSNSRR
jgi:hypothetical protein